MYTSGKNEKKAFIEQLMSAVELSRYIIFKGQVQFRHSGTIVSLKNPFMVLYVLTLIIPLHCHRDHSKTISSKES